MDFHSSDDFNSLMDSDDFDALNIEPIDRPITVTRFPNKPAKTMTVRQMTLAEIAAEITQAPPVKRKDDLPDYQLASYSGARTDAGCLRANDHLVYLSGCRADYDDGAVSCEDAVARLTQARIAALVLSTSSDQMPGKGHRWRIFALFSRNLPMSEYRQMIARIDAIFDNTLDPASYRPSQPMYSGAVIGGNPIRSTIVPGRPIDTADELAVELPDVESWETCAPDSVLTNADEGQKRLAREHVKSWIENLAAENDAYLKNGTAATNDTLFKAAATAGSLSAHGLIEYDWSRDLLVNYARETCKMRTAKGTFRSGWKNGFLKPMAERYVRMIVGYSDIEVQGWIDEFDELDELPVNRDDERREAQKRENERLQDSLPFSILPPGMTVAEMHEDCLWIAEGSQVGRLSNPRQILTFREFADLTAASVTLKKKGDKKTAIPNAQRWKSSDRRKTVSTRTFHAGAAAICLTPDGATALNSWRPIERRAATRDITPFLDQLDYLFTDHGERQAFLDWLAHIEQQPGILPHSGWLHIAANTGTGRNWLASVLSRVWRGYVAPNVDLPSLLDYQFNGPLAGRILAIVDEVQEAAGENPYRHQNKLKSLVNAEYRDINPKFGRQYREHNSCRWLVFSNHDAALPLNDTDRRWRVVRHDATPRSARDYANLYALLADDEFINAIAVHLQQRDISAFNPGGRPPMTAAKKAAVKASKTLVQGYAEDLVRTWTADVITNGDAARELADGGAAAGLTPAMRRALEEAGAVRIDRTLRVQGYPQRALILRNHDKWLNADASALADEANRPRDAAFGM